MSTHNSTLGQKDRKPMSTPISRHPSTSQRLGSAFSLQPSAFSLQVSGLALSALFALFALLLAPSAEAATATNTNNTLDWTTNATGWNNVTGSAWNSVNGITNTALFTNSSGSINVASSGIWLNGITYSPSGSFTIGGGTITMGGTTPTINVTNAAGTLTISSVLAGGNGLTKVGAGKLAYGTNDIIDDASAVTVTAGTFDIGAFSDTVGAVTLGNNREGLSNLPSITGTTGTLTGSSYRVTNGLISANLGGSSSTLTFAGSDGRIVTLSGSNSYSNTIINGVDVNTQGALLITTTDALPGWNVSGRYRVAAHAALAVGNNVSDASITTMLYGTTNFADKAAIGFDTSLGNRTYSGILSNTAQGNLIRLYKIGANTLTLTSTNTIRGQNMNFIHGGTLAFGTNNVLSTVIGQGYPNFRIDYGGTLDIGSFTNNARSIQLLDGSIIGTTGLLGSISGNFEVIKGLISANITTTGNLSKLHAGTVLLSGSNSFAGNTTINAGILTIATTNALPGWSTSGRFRVSSGATLAVYNAVTDASITNMVYGTTNFLSGSALGFDTTSGNRTSSLVLSNTTNGAGVLGLRKDGANTLTLTGANTYTGTTTISAGTLQLGDGGSTGSLATNSAITNNGNFTINRSNQVTQGTDFSSAAITGTGSFTQAGTGTTTLNAANTYTGTTTINGGTLAYGINNAIDSGGVTVNGGTLDIGAFTDTVGAVTLGSGTISGTGTLTGSSYSVTNGLISANLAGSTVNLTKSGTGTVLLSGSNSYSNTIVSAGILTIATTNALPAQSSNGRFSVASGAALAVYNAVTDASITNMVYGTTNFASGSAIGFDTTTANRSYSRVLSNTAQGTLGLTKTGANTLTLSAANNYTGTTTVNGGALSLGTTGRLSSTANVTVNAGSTLLLGSSVANSINSAAALSLGGGQLSMGAAGTGGSRASSQTFSSLTLTANSSINFANLTGLSSLYFSNISNLSNYTLSIFNYNGSNPFGGSSSTGGEGQFTKLYAATGGAFSSNLGNILFFAGSDANSSLIGQGSFSGPSVGGFTQIVPVPEPSVVIASLMLLSWLLYTSRGAMRRLIGCYGSADLIA